MPCRSVFNFHLIKAAKWRKIDETWSKTRQFGLWFVGSNQNVIWLKLSLSSCSWPEGCLFMKSAARNENKNHKDFPFYPPRRDLKVSSRLMKMQLQTDEASRQFIQFRFFVWFKKRHCFLWLSVGSNKFTNCKQRHKTGNVHDSGNEFNWNVFHYPNFCPSITRPLIIFNYCSDVNFSDDENEKRSWKKPSLRKNGKKDDYKKQKRFKNCSQTKNFFFVRKLNRIQSENFRTFSTNSLIG